MERDHALVLLALVPLITCCGSTASGDAPEDPQRRASSSSSSSSDGAHASSSMATGENATPIDVVADTEPNNGNSEAEVQRLPSFGGTQRLRITGTLPTGGFDAQSQRYLGDLDTYFFAVTTTGAFSIDVTWPEDADVDVLLVTDHVLAADTSTNKPAHFNATLLAGGTGGFGLFFASADNPASYTAELRFEPVPEPSMTTTSGGGPATGGMLDNECTHSTDYGLDTIYIFWPNNTYVENHEFTNIGTWERVEEGTYGINGSTITFQPRGGNARTVSFERQDNVDTYIDGDLFLCFDRT